MVAKELGVGTVISVCQVLDTTIASVIARRYLLLDGRVLGACRCVLRNFITREVVRGPSPP